MKNSRPIRAEGSPERASSRAPKLRKYRVLCAVTRSEWYEILAPDEETAYRTAFCEGELIEEVDVINLVSFDVKEVEP
jgi:hypothetical protein